MKKVWLVVVHTYDGPELYGTYSSEERAEARLKEVNEGQTVPEWKAVISELDVDVDHEWRYI